MHTFSGMLRRVDELLEGTDLRMGLEGLTNVYYGTRMATIDDIGRYGEFENEECVIQWSNLLDRYLEMCDFFVQAQHVREQIPGRPGSALERTWRRMDAIDNITLSYDSPTYLPYERLYWSHLVVRFTDESDFPNFITYLREIHDFIDKTDSEFDRNDLQEALNRARYPMQNLFVKYKDILNALRELREELVKILKTLDSKMLSFAMGTHDRLGEGSRVSLLERDTLSIIRHMLDKNH